MNSKYFSKCRLALKRGRERGSPGLSIKIIRRKRTSKAKTTAAANPKGTSG
jgi:hypothetical protein